MERALLRSMPVRSFEGSPVGVGAIVRLEEDDGERLVFVVPAGGGRRVELEGVSIQFVTPAAPLGAALLGCVVDDGFELSIKGRQREASVLEIA